MPQQIAVVFALCAFAVSSLAGLLTSITATTALLRAIVVLAVAYPIGRVMGAVLRAALNEHLTAAIAAAPIPESIRTEPRAEQDAGDVEVIGDVESL